ncbi:MAG TPA: hypothetical protein VMR34_02995 [Candidatus Saccharimonadales bacterium]|nr:hypothetical protein [Candidatus Saccharimonadales bacterium]
MEQTAKERLKAALDTKFGPPTGDTKKDFARNLMRLSFGVATVEEVGEPFYRTQDGTLGIYVQGTPFEEIARTTSE